MTKHLHQPIIASGSIFYVQEKMEIFSETSHSFALLLQAGKPHEYDGFSRKHFEDGQELDNQALNQAFFESKLACVFEGPKHALQALYTKRKNRCPLATSTPARMSFHIP